MNNLRKNGQGIMLCLIIAIPSWFLGKLLPIIGGPVFSILTGMIIALFIKDKRRFEPGIKYTSKNILQYAVILLGFGLNLSVILMTGRQSLPIILGTITTSLFVAFVLHKVLNIPTNISTLIGVGSSICGGSAIAATAPVIEANDDEVAQAFAVIFFYNALAAFLFPSLGTWLGFSKTSGNAFGIFAGSAINDTSSVTSASSTWDCMYNLGSATLDKAVTVKLTRTLAIIPVTLSLALSRNQRCNTERKSYNLKKIFPTFILYFILASILTTIAIHFGISSTFFAPFKELSKFFIILAMASIGLNTNMVKLAKTSRKPLFLGFCCWIVITLVSLCLQHMFKIW